MTMKVTECVDVAIIGGGPAGLSAAIAVARAGLRPVILDARERVGETIRRTGDGRCNISNAQVSAWDYHNHDFVRRAFLRCSPKQTISFLESCGILLREEGQGRLYPVPNKATAVIEALLAEVRRLNIETRCEQKVSFIRRNADAWTISCDDAPSLRARQVIVCTGGGMKKDFLPTQVPIMPAQPILAPLACDPEPLRGLDKIRVRCSLTCGDYRETGEVTFRTYGISGICAFNLSRVAQPGDELTIDFMPELASAETDEFLQKRLDGLKPATWIEFTTGMLLPQVAHAVLRAACLPENDAPNSDDMPAFARVWRAFPLTVRGIGDKSLAQVQRGGIAVDAIDPHTMAVKNNPGLFAAGEAVDIDGPCGGYNLHWAWTSGQLAGQEAARAVLGASSQGGNVRP